MATIFEQFESALLSRAMQTNLENPYTYATGYLLSMVQDLVKQYPDFEHNIETRISSLQHRDTARTDTNVDEEIVYFY